MSGGRPREIGTARFATVTEVAEAMSPPRSPQAIYNRIKAGTIPYERDIDPETGRASYRIPREWLLRELERQQNGEPASVKDADDRTLDLMTAYEAGIERVASEIAGAKDVIRREVEIQHTRVVPLLEAIADAQVRQAGEVQQIIHNQQELFKLLRQVVARAEEEDRREAEYQNKNLELQQENQALQRETLEVQRKLAEQLARVEEAERERAETGQLERRSFWRRVFGS